MIWWAEPESPATLKFVGPPLAGAPVYGSAPRAGPTGKQPAPGEILSLTPLVIATGDGSLECTRTEWRGSSPPELHLGQIIT